MHKIGFLGPRGTFSQEAVELYTRNRTDCQTYDYNSISDAILAVQRGDIDEVVAPIENSLEGAVNATLDMLAFTVDLQIRAELVIEINQNLLVKPETKLADIKYILSHPQGIGQCRKYIDTVLPQAGIKLVYSTAGAAEEVAQGNGELAAIGSKAAAGEYGLKLLAERIQDGDNNMTRFVVIARKDCRKTGFDRTSIVFSTENQPGSLYKILDIFGLWDINMMRIESRPAKDQLGKYIFFVDLEGHSEDEDVRDALTMVKRKASFYKFLGSYPRWTSDRV